MDIPQNISTIGHSGMVAKAAYDIVKLVLANNPAHTVRSDMPTPDVAFRYGLFHDIGKLYLTSETKYKHPLLGYKIMIEAKQNDIANVCIAHPFPVFDSDEYIMFYCHDDAAEADNISQILRYINLNFSIKLIQFCDKISNDCCYLSLEQKFDWYSRAYGATRSFIYKNFEILHNIKKEIDLLIGDDVYKVLHV
jgi:hypothetical protein